GGAEVLPDRGGASADANVASAGGCLGLFQRGMDSFGDEMERRPALHRHRGTGMMGEDERRHVVRRLITPPSFPLLIRPRPADWPEHVAPEDPGAHILESLFRDVVVHAGVAARL